MLISPSKFFFLVPPLKIITSLFSLQTDIARNKFSSRVFGNPKIYCCRCKVFACRLRRSSVHCRSAGPGLGCASRSCLLKLSRCSWSSARRDARYAAAPCRHLAVPSSRSSAASWEEDGARTVPDGKGGADAGGVISSSVLSNIHHFDILGMGDWSSFMAKIHEVVPMDQQSELLQKQKEG
ncbi:hypothetical protein M9H77_34600 [Catharanthus roseus]|uniref:Uncharacterized protein n=1 Tax=Catharanthus roseus TaxID=4058 RepID=A0ACB9ZQ85_CATRO|nr:hypothetical protein M9H77_34600 [Catharanthus roseus]